MLCSPGNKINNSQIIGELVDESYKTKTGGFLQYGKNDETNETQNLYWIPEEIHEIKKDVSLLMVNNQTYIEAGTEIIKDIKAENSGYLEIVEENGIVEKLIIKVGQIIQTSDIETQERELPEIVKPGGNLYDNVKAESPYFVERIKEGLLIRPIDEYKISKEQFQVKTMEINEILFGKIKAIS